MRRLRIALTTVLAALFLSGCVVADNSPYAGYPSNTGYGSYGAANPYYGPPALLDPYAGGYYGGGLGYFGEYGHGYESGYGAHGEGERGEGERGEGGHGEGGHGEGGHGDGGHGDGGRAGGWGGGHGGGHR